MGPTVLGGVAALLLVLTWTLRRRSPVLLRSTDASGIAALNRAQIAQLRQSTSAGSAAGFTSPEAARLQPSGEAPAALEPSLPAAADARQRLQLLAALERQLQGDPAQRLGAMRTACRWGHMAALPLLRRGLRDVDPAVVLEAARGLERFRCCPLVNGAALAAQPLPRNVARMR